MAEGSHPFPFRTRKLSPPAPMVLGSRGPGRVGRRRALTVRRTPVSGVLRRFRPPFPAPDGPPPPGRPPPPTPPPAAGDPLGAGATSRARGRRGSAGPTP